MQGSIVTLTHPSFLVEKIYMAQNSLELKLPYISSPLFYAKQRTCSTRGKKCTLRLVTPSFQWVTFHTRAYIYLLFSWISATARKSDKCNSSQIWLLPLLASLKVICSCKVPVLLFLNLTFSNSLTLHLALPVLFVFCKIQLWICGSWWLRW